MKQAIILGGGAKARCFDFQLAEDDDVEIWGINFSVKDWVPRYDRMFNVHRYTLLKKYGYPCWRDAVWALEHPKTRIVLADDWPDKRMAHAEIFPRAQLQAKYPRGEYHCNSCDWLITLALYEGFGAVHLHGFALEREGMMEQTSAAKCAEYWVGYAEGLGMKVHVGEDSAMFGVYHLTKTNRVYGYDDSPAYEDRTSEGKDPPYRYDDY
jgi:hypothetical protein